MADGTHIQWTDATLFGPALPKRCSKCRDVKPASDFARDRSRKADGLGFVCWSCRYPRPETATPGRRERRARAAAGQRWCRLCDSWHPAEQVTKRGLCRDHERRVAREIYATNEQHRRQRIAHATRRKRGVEPVPLDAQEVLLEEFDGACAYCGNLASTWDHVVAVSKGGKTEPCNILPCCRSCNSSKRDRDLDEWLAATGRGMCVRAIERLSHFQVI